MTYREAFVLIGLTVGTVLYFFLLILLVGARHRRPIERVAFFLLLAAFLYFSGFLLFANAWGTGAHQGTVKFSLVILQVGLTLMPPLLFHTHLEYRRLLTGWTPSIAWKVGVVTAYAFSAYTFLFQVHFGVAVTHSFLPFWVSGAQSSSLLVSLVFAVFFQLLFFRHARQHKERHLFSGLAICFAAAILLPISALTIEADAIVDYGSTLLMIWPALPGAIVVYWVLRRNFLGIAFRRNLAYAVAGGFLAVLYLTLVSRISQWLEPWFPPVATISILVFVLVFLFEPLQRELSRAMQHLMRVEVDKLQRLITDVQDCARGGALAPLVHFIESRVRAEFSLAAARLVLQNETAPSAAHLGRMERYPLRRVADDVHRMQSPSREDAGVLEAYYHGAMLSGETHAALESLAAQLPAALDLCRAIEEKLRLERELAERERFAMLGQMAASITHNLKNPLGSMKTLLQLQMENPSAPEEIRRDCEMVVGEIDRMSAKLQQLLHFARPAVRAGKQAAPIDAASIIARLLDLIRKDAAQRGIALLFERPPGELLAPAPEDAVTDIFQNLIVNAVEASGRRGTVKVALERNGPRIQFSVSDEGPGIPHDVQARIFQPFFTTKPSGTGLGLAIVQRRLNEIGGTIECHSPVAGDRGTRFVVEFPA